VFYLYFPFPPILYRALPAAKTHVVVFGKLRRPSDDHSPRIWRLGGGQAGRYKFFWMAQDSGIGGPQSLSLTGVLPVWDGILPGVEPRLGARGATQLFV